MFIVLEGGDGSGKSTLLKLLGYYVTSLSKQVVLTREPGGTPVSEALRSVVLLNNMNALTETYAFAAARVEHCSEVIIPALLRGHWVISDRFHGSTYVYQQCEKGVCPRVVGGIVDSVSKLFADECLPHFPTVTDLELVLDVDYPTAVNRLGRRSLSTINRLDTLDRTVFDARRQHYADYAAKTSTAVLIDAKGTIAQTLELARLQIVRVMRDQLMLRMNSLYPKIDQTS